MVQIAPGLRVHVGGGYNAGMARENKTAYLRFRVAPSVKAMIDRLADETGRNATELVEAAVGAYSTTADYKRAVKKLQDRDALAQASQPASQEGK